jgi:hypothetical protein
LRAALVQSGEPGTGARSRRAGETRDRSELPCRRSPPRRTSWSTGRSFSGNTGGARIASDHQDRATSGDPADFGLLAVVQAAAGSSPVAHPHEVAAHDGLLRRRYHDSARVKLPMSYRFSACRITTSSAYESSSVAPTDPRSQGVVPRQGPILGKGRADAMRREHDSVVSAASVEGRAPLRRPTRRWCSASAAAGQHAPHGSEVGYGCGGRE